MTAAALGVGAPTAAFGALPGFAAHRPRSRPLSPSPVTAVLGIAAGALGAAALGSHGVHAAHGIADAASTVTAELRLTSGASPAVAASTTPTATVTPVAADHTSAAATVPELTKAATMQHHQQTVDAAIDRFESKIGATNYENYCERAVENAFGTQGHYGSAIDDWHARDQHSDWQHAPRGALVFYDTSVNGHVALSLGDGRVVSSSAHHQVGVVPVGFFQNPLGWAYAPY